MANWYFNNAVDTSFVNVGNWWANSNGTGAHPASVPWMSSATQNDNLLPVTGFEGYASLNVNAYDADPVVSLGDGVSITGTCSVKIDLWGGGEDASFGAISSGNYTSEIVGSYNGGINKAQFGLITGGTFSGRVFVAAVTGGNFNGLTEPFQISGTAVCETTATVTSTVLIQGGVFNCPVTRGSQTSGGTFNAAVTSTVNVTGGTYNAAFIQNSGIISGGTFNGTFTRTGGTVTGGTFNNGLLAQFFRNGFPPPLIFNGHNPASLDVLGTGL